MTALLHDPPDGERYLGCLNRCFGRWGGPREWGWTFERDAGHGLASRLVVSDETGAWIAGSAVSWRATTTFGTVGIMTGSWTLPEARGRGCFTSLVREPSALVARRGGGALLAFVTATNTSRRRLEAAGARMLPTAYARTPAPVTEGGSDHWLPAAPDTATLDALGRLHAGDRGETLGFVYPTAESFAGQFVTRPLPTTLLHDPAAGWWAIIEEAPDTDRLLFLAGSAADPRADPRAWRSLAARAGRRGRSFFGFAAHPAQIDAVRAAGLDVLPGFLTMNRATAARDRDPGPPDPLPAGPATVQSGDRM